MAEESQTSAASSELGTNARSKGTEQIKLTTSLNFPVETSVVIDFAKAAARSSLGTKDNKTSLNSDLLQNPAGNVAQGATFGSMNYGKKNDETGAIFASELASEQSNVKVTQDFVEFGAVGTDAPLPEPNSVSNFQSTSISTQRVDQIVRAVVEETQKLSDPRMISNTLAVQGNANGQALRMSLHPVELGSVDITISKRGRRLEVTISPQIDLRVRFFVVMSNSF